MSRWRTPTKSLRESEIRSVIESLPLPHRLDVEGFLKVVEEARGRPITLIHTPVHAIRTGPCGVWLRRAYDDIILVEGRTSEYHRRNIVFHEFGHMLLGHDENAGDPVGLSLIKSLAPSIDPESVGVAMGRSSYLNEQEVDAETFASMLSVGRTRPFHEAFTDGR